MTRAGNKRVPRHESNLLTSQTPAGRRSIHQANVVRSKLSNSVYNGSEKYTNTIGKPVPESISQVQKNIQAGRRSVPFHSEISGIFP